MAWLDAFDIFSFSKNFLPDFFNNQMVCVPCIFLPFLLAIYLKFVQPFILRLVPERWKIWFDSILYPTCPVKVPTHPEPSAPKEEELKSDEDKKEM